MISPGQLLNLEFVFRTDYGVLFRVNIEFNVRSQTVSLIFLFGVYSWTPPPL
jgi:hypothetical protein